MDAEARTKERLAMAWMRRKRFEARLIAVEVAKVFSGEGAGNERVDADQLLASIGMG